MDALLSQWRAALLWPSLACVKEVVAHSLQSRAEPTDGRGNTAEGVRVWAFAPKSLLYHLCELGHIT